MSRLLATFAVIWRLAHPYFFSEDRVAGRTLLASVVLIELSLVGINVMINQWQNTFYNALQDRAWDAFVHQLMIFSLLAGTYVVLAVYQLYLQQWLLIRWRTWMTRRYLDHWLAGSNHYRMQLLGDAADNPDQRIAEDIKLFAEKAILIGIRVLGASVSFVSFVVILWGLSADAPLQLFGYEVSIPGYLVWAALLYAFVGTAVTHWIGKPLINLNFLQQRYEADFRFNLVRVRENSEQIALLKGEAAEDERLQHRFSFVIDNWRAIMSRLKRLTLLTASYAQASTVFPFIVVSPAYFAGKVQLGGLMQTASAFNSVREALSIFIDVYRELAEWRAVIARLDGFDAAIAQAKATAGSQARDRGPGARRRQVCRDRRSLGAAAERQAAGRGRGHRDQTRRRQRAGHRPLRRREVDAVPRDCGYLAVRQWRHPGAGGRARHGDAAAAVFPGIDAGGGGELPGRARDLRFRAARGGRCRGRIAGAGRTPGSGSALEPGLIPGRTAAARHRARASAKAGLPLPRRVDCVA